MPNVDWGELARRNWGMLLGAPGVVAQHLIENPDAPAKMREAAVMLRDRLGVDARNDEEIVTALELEITTSLSEVSDDPHAQLELIQRLIQVKADLAAARGMRGDDKRAAMDAVLRELDAILEATAERRNAEVGAEVDMHAQVAPKDTMIVATGPRSVAVFGDPAEATAIIEALRAGAGPARRVADVGSSAVSAAGAAGAAATALEGLSSLQGVVQLAPETLSLLQSGAMFMQSGSSTLGMLVDASGQIVGPAHLIIGAESIGAMVGAVGPGVALAAIQYSLHRLQKTVDEIVSITSTHLTESRTHRLAEIRTIVDEIVRESGWALEMNEVPPAMVVGLRSHTAALQAYCDATTRLTHDRVRQLNAKNTKARADWLRGQEGETFVEEAVALWLASQAWFAATALRSAEQQQAGHDAYADRILEHAHGQASRWRADAQLAVATAQRSLSVTAHRPGGEFAFRARRRASESATALGDYLRSALPQLEPPRPDLGLVLGLPERERAALADVLRWTVTPSEVVELVVGVVIDGQRHFLLVTSGRILIAHYETFMSEAVLKLDAPRAAADAEADGDTIIVQAADQRFVMTSRSDTSAGWRLAALRVTALLSPKHDSASIALIATASMAPSPSPELPAATELRQEEAEFPILEIQQPEETWPS